MIHLWYTNHACLLPQHLIIICAAPFLFSICHSLLFLMSRCRCVRVHYYYLPSLPCWAFLMREILTFYALSFCVLDEFSLACLWCLVTAAKLLCWQNKYANFCWHFVIFSCHVFCGFHVGIPGCLLPDSGFQ